MTTGLYGGSFNPIHVGHVELGRWLVGQGIVDELWFLVSPQNPLKRNDALLDDAARLRLAHIAVEETKSLRVSDFEFRLPRPSFMVHTLEALRVTYPEREFVLVIGADNWERFPQWHRSDEILRHHRIIVYPRPGYELSPADLPEGVTMAASPLIDISSTEIRDAIANDPGYDGRGLPPAVWEAIRREGYYR